MSDIGSGWFGRKRNTARAGETPKGKKPRSRRSGIIALEPRMMYDGAGAHTAAATGHHHHDVADHNQMATAEKHLDQAERLFTGIEHRRFNGARNKRFEHTPQIRGVGRGSRIKHETRR